MFTNVSGVLSADVAANGTFTVAYPAGLTAGHFAGSALHALVLAQSVLAPPSGFTLTFGATTITITNKTSGTWVSGSSFILQLDQMGNVVVYDPSTGFAPANTVWARSVVCELGSPALAVANGICTSQAVTAATAAVLTATSLDVPRNVVAAWTGTAIVTVVGVDQYGVVMSEASASGTSFTGKKAFKTITSVTFNANVTAATVGFGVVLGLPFFLNQAAFIQTESVNGAKPGTAGTVVAGVTSAATTTTGDVRGTYNPNTAPDGQNTYVLIAVAPDAGFKGVTQA